MAPEFPVQSADIFCFILPLRKQGIDRGEFVSNILDCLLAHILYCSVDAVLPLRCEAGEVRFDLERNPPNEESLKKSPEHAHRYKKPDQVEMYIERPRGPYIRLARLGNFYFPIRLGEPDTEHLFDIAVQDCPKGLQRARKTGVGFIQGSIEMPVFGLGDTPYRIRHGIGYPFFILAGKSPEVPFPALHILREFPDKFDLDLPLELIQVFHNQEPRLPLILPGNEKQLLPNKVVIDLFVQDLTTESIPVEMCLDGGLESDSKITEAAFDQRPGFVPEDLPELKISVAG